MKAPVHTDSLTVYQRKLRVIRTDDGHQIHEQQRVAESVVEQRISHFVMGLAIIGTMTGPLLTVLNLIPRALFGGVFFVVGVSVSPKLVSDPFIETLKHSGVASKATAY